MLIKSVAFPAPSPFGVKYKSVWKSNGANSVSTECPSGYCAVLLSLISPISLILLSDYSNLHTPILEARVKTGFRQHSTSRVHLLTCWQPSEKTQKTEAVFLASWPSVPWAACGHYYIKPLQGSSVDRRPSRTPAPFGDHRDIQPQGLNNYQLFLFCVVFLCMTVPQCICWQDGGYLDLWTVLLKTVLAYILWITYVFLFSVYLEIRLMGHRNVYVWLWPWQSPLFQRAPLHSHHCMRAAHAPNTTDSSPFSFYAFWWVVIRFGLNLHLSCYLKLVTSLYFLTIWLFSLMK